MKQYEKPIALANEELSEGVYAASGTMDCWTIGISSVQDWNGSHHVFEATLTHSDTMEHISNGTQATYTFNYPVADAYSEFDCTFGGSTVVVNRQLLADAYKSGDSVTYKVWVQAADEATTKALECTGCSVVCDKAINVQGNGGDEL